MQSAPPPPPAGPSLETREEVMFFDTDAGGVVHNVAYLRFIETCRTRLGARIGLDVRAMAETRQFAVVVRTEIDYRRPAVLADELVVRGWLERVERVRFWCGFSISRPVDGAELVTCRQALALVQLPAGRPIRLPDAWREQWPALATTGGHGRRSG
jgi:YbgC/YbaW family acyl-CoA thioester hydrolase